MMDEIKLIAVDYQKCRLDFFKEQLAAAHRRLDWSIRHNPDWLDHAEKGEVVSFYEWAVKMAENSERDDAILTLYKLLTDANNPVWNRFLNNKEILDLAKYLVECGVYIVQNDPDMSDMEEKTQ